MSHTDFLSALRHVYHSNLLSLQEAKKTFRTQMRKMQRVHGIQLKNMELIAVGAAIQMFTLKTHDVKIMFNEEKERLWKDYD